MKRIGFILLLCCLFACSSSSFVYEEQESALDTIEMVVNHPPSKIVMYSNNREMKAETSSPEEIANILDWFKAADYNNQVGHGGNEKIEMYFYDENNNFVKLDYSEIVSSGSVDSFIGVPESKSIFMMNSIDSFRESLPEFLAVNEKGQDFYKNDLFKYLNVVTQDVSDFSQIENSRDLLLMVVEGMEESESCSMTDYGKIKCEDGDFEIEEMIYQNRIYRYYVKDVQERLDSLFVDTFQIKDLDSGIIGYRNREVFYLDKEKDAIFGIYFDRYREKFQKIYPARLIRKSGNTSVYEVVELEVLNGATEIINFLYDDFISGDREQFKAVDIEERLDELQHYEVTMEGNKIKSVKVLNTIETFEAPISKKELVNLFEFDNGTFKAHPDILLISARNIFYADSIEENDDFLTIGSFNESHLFDRSTGENLSNLEVIERYLPDGIDAFIQQQVNLPVCSHTYEEQLGVRCVDYLDPFFDLDYGDVIAPTDFYIDEDGNLALDVRIKEDGGVVEVKSLKVN